MDVRLAGFILTILIWGCGPDDDKIGYPIQQKRKEHEAIGLIRTGEFDCTAFLEGREDQAIAPSHSLAENVWFDTKQGLTSFKVISRQTMANGFSRLTFSKPVSPNFFKIEKDYDGWNEKNGVVFFRDSYAECKIYKDGRHLCQADKGATGAPIVDQLTGLVVGIHQTDVPCPDSGASCKYTPAFLLN